MRQKKGNKELEKSFSRFRNFFKWIIKNLLIDLDKIIFMILNIRNWYQNSWEGCRFYSISFFSFNSLINLIKRCNDSCNGI